MIHRVPCIYPSLMAAPLLRVADAMDMLEPYVDGWHLDVMDGHFVPNITFGPDFIQEVVRNTKKHIDVHLMTQPVDPWLEWLPSGITSVTFHPEATPHAYRLLQSFRAKGIKSGVALSPGTGLHVLEALAPVLDSVLVLCVNPGWGGQSFIHDMVAKIKQVRSWIHNRPITLYVDGGVNLNTAPLCHDADVLIMGSALLGASDPLHALKQLRGVH